MNRSGMNRREFIKTAVWGTAAIAVGGRLSAGESAISKKRPNVLLINIDDMGYGDMSCHGNPVFNTPNLDKLHAGSVRFTQYHAQPMCTPTRGQLMTGVHCLRNGSRWVGTSNTHLRKDLPTMADIFKASGYGTAIFGKWHIGDNYPYRPQDRGFDEVITFPMQEIGSPNDYWGNDYFDDTLKHNGKYEKYDGYCNDVWFDQAMKWMQGKVEKDEPFFCYIPTNLVHGPYYVEQAYRERVSIKDLHPQFETFFGMLVNLDDNIGRITKFLDKTGIRDNTIVIFMSDNGGTAGVNTYNAGMKGWKSKLWEGGHRAPLFISWPGGGFSKPVDIDGLAGPHDILPTLIDLCGLRKPNNPAYEGTSMAKQLRGEAGMPDRVLVVQFQRGPQPKKYDACIMWGPWRLMNNHDLDRDNVTLELYNVERDPHQDNNVIDAHPYIVSKLKSYYEKWWEETEKTFDIPRPITIGNDAENPMCLACTSWTETYFTQISDILEGRNSNGIWDLIVDRSGEYEFALRRWPEEAKTPIAGSTDLKLTDTYGYGPERKGTALPITEAEIEIAGKKEKIEVKPEDHAAVFTLKLKKGKAQLRTAFYDSKGKELCGAYFVYVRRK